MTDLGQLQDALLEAREALRLARVEEESARVNRQDAQREVERLATLIEATKKEGK